MANSFCPSCKAQVYLGSRARLGDFFKCSGCGLDLELVWLDPPELDLPWEYPDDEIEIYDDIGVDEYEVYEEASDDL